MIRLFTIFFCGFFLLFAGWAHAAKAPRIEVVLSRDNALTQKTLRGFKDHFNSQNIQVDIAVHSLVGDDESTQSIMDSLSSTKPDLVLALGKPAIKKAGSQLNNIPIVGSLSLNSELFEQYKNLTGVKLEFPIVTQSEWLQKTLPDVRNVGVIYNSKKNQDLVRQADRIFKKAGLNLQQIQIKNPTDLISALKKLENSVDVLWGLSDPMVLNKSTARSILLFSLRNKIPFVGLSEAWVKAGAIYALQWDYADIGQQCAKIALMLIDGKRPESIKVASPRTVRYSLNQKIAERMKIEFANSLIQGAESVY